MTPATPSRAISPILANLYLHYVLDVWAKAWREKVARGDMIIVRYADDAVLGFQHREDAERFLEQLQKRVRKFGLELHPDRTRLIEFGRYAAESRKKRGEGKPETFNFLGFTHISGRSRKNGYFTVYRKTMGKRMAAKLKDIGQKLRQRMHTPDGGTVTWLISVVRGYFQYHAVPDNEPQLRRFATTCYDCGCASFDDAVNGAAGLGDVFWSALGPCSQTSRSCTLGRLSGLPPGIRGRNRVR